MRVFSRRGNDWTDRVPRIADGLAVLKVMSITIDGEGVVCRRDGVSDFDLLCYAVGPKGSRDAFLHAFDLLELDGHDLRRAPWEAPARCARELAMQQRVGTRCQSRHSVFRTP